MPLAFYSDVHVPAAITEGLRRRGIDVLTSQQDGTRQSEDVNLFRRATQLQRVLLTQDEDFLVIAASWQDAGWEFIGVVFAPQDPSRNGRYIEDIELIGSCCDIPEVANRVIHLPLS
jgi:hypothetical protein